MNNPELPKNPETGLPPHEELVAMGSRIFNNAYAVLSYFQPELATPGALEIMDPDEGVSMDFIVDEPDITGKVRFRQFLDGSTPLGEQQVRVNISLYPETQETHIERTYLGGKSGGTVIVHGWLPSPPRFLSPAITSWVQDYEEASPENLQSIQDTYTLLNGMVRSLGR